MIALALVITAVPLAWAIYAWVDRRRRRYMASEECAIVPPRGGGL